MSTTAHLTKLHHGRLREASRRHPDQMPEPPQLAPLEAEERRFYSELLPDDRASHPISKGEPAEKAHFGRLYSQSRSFGHYPQFVTIGEMRSHDTNMEISTHLWFIMEQILKLNTNIFRLFD